MSQVQGKLLYHISRENNWEIGQAVIAGEKENPFWLGCKNYTPIVPRPGGDLPLRKVLSQHPACPWGASQDIFDWLYEQLRNVSTEFAFYVREQTFEAVRKDCFPQRPSRQKCLWLTEANQISYWLTLDPNTPRSLLELELCGEIFRGDAHWLEADTFSSLEYADRAQHYWAEELSCSPQIEYLFCGTAIIKKVTSIS